MKSYDFDIFCTNLWPNYFLSHSNLIHSTNIRTVHPNLKKLCVSFPDLFFVAPRGSYRSSTRVSDLLPSGRYWSGTSSGRGGTCVSDTGEVIFEGSEEMPDHGDTPRTSEQPLTGQTAHVGDVGVVDRETKHPLHLGAPQNVLLLVHEDGEVLVFSLFDGVRPGRDRPHFIKLGSPSVL